MAEESKFYSEQREVYIQRGLLSNTACMLVHVNRCSTFHVFKQPCKASPMRLFSGTLEYNTAVSGSAVSSVQVMSNARCSLSSNVRQDFFNNWKPLQ
jgi:hypothetical protein